ncbi:MAG: hypothetical protein KF837_24530 [Labilithrix sp.]|nr:hypothetical protein [Labilithrix sp.]
MFDRGAAQLRVERLWKLGANFGTERGTNRVYLDEIVSDRMQLTSGLQVLRDELQFADATPPVAHDREACTADFTIPSVVTTLACTNCGDRIHYGEMDHYQRVVASRFATLSEVGTLKPEAFSPTGGGTDDGGVLAHVTWAHALDDALRARLYEGNSQSYVLCAFDLKTHVGRDYIDGTTVYGKTRESLWREPRAACGAVMATLQKFDGESDVHKRIRTNLGEAGYELLAKKGVRSEEGVEITAAVAGAIVAVQGIYDTARALMKEMDERGMAHLTASMTINRPGMPDLVLYLARATVFGGTLTTQGFGVDASKYGGRLVQIRDEKRLQLTYDGITDDNFEIVTQPYAVREVARERDIYV